MLAFLEKAIRDDDPNMSARIELLDGSRDWMWWTAKHRARRVRRGQRVIGEPDVWSLGYGREAMALLLDFGFDQLDLRTIWLIVRTENTRAVRFFTRLGFVIGRDA